MAHRFLPPFLLLVAFLPCSRADGSAEARTGAFRLDLRPSPRLAEAGATESLTFGDSWDGLAGDAVRIDLDGTEYATRTGEGTVGWTPSAPGLYTFAHTTLSGGSATGAVLSASFLVEGVDAADLTILATSDLKEGTGVALGGAPAGWTLHYTTDGSDPTAASPEYTGPFTLTQSATVKVVAVSANGTVSGVAERRFDLAPPLAVVGARARQRYPWNGLVDVDFTLEGDAICTYRVALVARDVDGGTNLAVRTVWEDRGAVTNDTIDLRPGVHRFVWNAATDLPEGFAVDRVAIGVHADSVQETALYMVVDLSGGPDTNRYPVSYLPDVPAGGWSDEYKTDKLVLRRIEPGTFTMGRRVTDYPTAHESILRQTSLSAPFYVGVFETTQGQWENLGETTTGQYPGAERPAYGIAYDSLRGTEAGASWPNSAAVDFSSPIGTIRAKTLHAGFDLPTEAQWEYACRAGTDAALHSGKNITTKEYSCPNVSEVGRFCGNSGWRWNSAEYATITNGAWDGKGGYDKIAVVGSYAKNAWGVHDMHGNVWEWCLDWMGSRTADPVADPLGPATGTGRIVRGGSWNSDPWEEASGERRGSASANSTMGFRLFLHDAPAVVEAPIISPAGLTATSNRVSDVMLSWNPVEGAYAYQIRRSKTVDFADGTWLNTVTNTTYIDWTAESRTHYTYWVRAQFESGRVGVWSESSEGVASGELPAPTNVLENSRYEDCMDLVWDPVPGAVVYEIFNSGRDSSSPANAVKVYETAEPNFLDEYRVYGDPRENLWIRAKDADGNASAFVGPFEYGNGAI